MLKIKNLLKEIQIIIKKSNIQLLKNYLKQFNSIFQYLISNKKKILEILRQSKIII